MAHESDIEKCFLDLFFYSHFMQYCCNINNWKLVGALSRTLMLLFLFSYNSWHFKKQCAKSLSKAVVSKLCLDFLKELEIYFPFFNKQLYVSAILILFKSKDFQVFDNINKQLEKLKFRICCCHLVNKFKVQYFSPNKHK